MLSVHRDDLVQKLVIIGAHQGNLVRRCLNPVDGQHPHGATHFWSIRIVKLINSESGVTEVRELQRTRTFRSLAVMSAHLVLLDIRKAGNHLVAGRMDPPPAVVDRSISFKPS